MALVQLLIAGGGADVQRVLSLEGDGRATVLTRRNDGDAEHSAFTISDDRVRALREALADAALSAADAQRPVHRGDDGFGYVLTYAGHSVPFADGDVPARIAPAFRMLAQIQALSYAVSDDDDAARPVERDPRAASRRSREQSHAGLRRGS